ncbi:flagellar hook-basal body complex protein [Hyphococcus luteus]|uniref:Flagellar basal-body rod protein FlgF n=1 Tax=Hyphococcus luteus TaxID=2058213 RepID=A0A2S7K4I7_9PROT|nr:flagellar hook-basal body complex protein [Marinicaulis flavus]PQA87420.1 flagellar basal-body rod protein FlgF [Marinicaulis flavus]
MSNTVYAALSKQAGLSKELNSVANNIANASTAGYRREGMLFSEYVRALGPQDRSISQANVGGHYFDATPGAVTQTGGMFDVAIDGEGYFLVETPFGERLTRQGSFMLNAEGQLVTSAGHRVLGDGGSPIAIPPEATSITIAQDGSIAADGAPIGKLGLVTVEPTALAREGANLLRAEEEYREVEFPKLRQGFIEESNVNTVLEVSRLIEVQRAYEMGQQLLKDEDERISKTVDAMRRR